MIFLWSDTHFGHDAIRVYCARPDADVLAMNERLIAAWNSVVRPQDTIYHLGDFGFRRADGAQGDLAAIFARLRGHKHLVTGNHDTRNPKVLRLPWESISTLRTLREEGARAIVCHYPLASWEGAARHYLMLHGHSHGKLGGVPGRYDVGCDVWPTPVSLRRLWLHAGAFRRADGAPPFDL